MTVGDIVILIIVITFFIQILPVQTIACYTCVDCGDPFNAQSPNVSQSPTSCAYCYKLTVYMAYAPSRYVVKECVQTCTESGRIFGGASLQVNCCQSSSYCNNALRIDTLTNLVLSILMLVFICSIRKSFQ